MKDKIGRGLAQRLLSNQITRQSASPFSDRKKRFKWALQLGLCGGSKTGFTSAILRIS
jgi:hypothetical protein